MIPRIPGFELESPLTRDEAEARLRERVGGDVPLLMMPSSHPERPLRGRVRNGRFDVRLNTGYGNSFAAVYRGTIEPLPNGCRVQAYSDMPGATLIFLAIWGLATVALAMHALLNLDLMGLGRAAGMLIASVALLAVGQRLALREAAHVRSHLYQALMGPDPSPLSASGMSSKDDA